MHTFESEFEAKNARIAELLQENQNLHVLAFLTMNLIFWLIIPLDIALFHI